MTTRILGIESSCDETAAAVVADGREILSSVVASQIDIHRQYGGVVPELASREHLRQIVPVVREALSEASVRRSRARRHRRDARPGPGRRPARRNYLRQDPSPSFGEAADPGQSSRRPRPRRFPGSPQSREQSPKLPAVCLIVSGGHTVLYEVMQDPRQSDLPLQKNQPNPRRRRGRSLRQSSQAAGPRLPRRPHTRSADGCRKRRSRPGKIWSNQNSQQPARFQLQRSENRRSLPRSRTLRIRRRNPEKGSGFGPR